MRVLVTGAAGYIGSHTCKQLKLAGYFVLGTDRNLPKHNYYDDFVIRDFSNCQDLLLNIDAVVHIGAMSQISISMSDSAMYYKKNVQGTQILMDICRAQGIDKFVFASSAACYGSPKTGICKEFDNHTPMNPYGWSKRMTEIMLEDYARAYNFNSVSLRFFNVAGADLDCELGQEKSATHIIARIMESAINKKEFNLFGNDYNTPDGTCVRDYVHVDDIAKGIICSLKYLENNTGASIFNLGSESGYSNMDIINSVKANTPLDVKYSVSPRREGDPDMLIADVKSAKDVLGWTANYHLDTIVTSAYNWYTKDIHVLNSEKEIEQITTN